MVAESFTTVGPPALTEARREWFDSNARQVRAGEGLFDGDSGSVLAIERAFGVFASIQDSHAAPFIGYISCEFSLMQVASLYLSLRFQDCWSHSSQLYQQYPTGECVAATGVN
ncbi:hypothetical protein PC129_g11756 [Phytophthora cactorum]|uniref:Uncharacterized protein n=1 Tax=Phytophthora cactorum TaxID=29920 RepID=A0A8T1HZD7_9STRA|nr:hypothetical protein PC129_g11756 [Phytophthora cactorum]